MSISDGRVGRGDRAAATETLTDGVIANLAATVGTAYERTLLGWWLVPQPQHRQRVLARWARLWIGNLRPGTVVDCTAERQACALWLRWPSDPPPDWPRSLAEATSPYSLQFGRLHRGLAEARRPIERHCELLHVGVRPPLQRRGLGSQLIKHRLQILDGQRRSAHTVAINPDTQRWLTRFRFLPYGPPIRVADDCPPLQPMWRTPSTESPRRTRHR